MMFVAAHVGHEAAVPLPQVATGDIVTGMLTDANMTPEVYVWVHGPSENPFEPHLDLDGESFTDFTDDRLQNPADWPPVAYLFPGDLVGCSCDVVTQWALNGQPTGPNTDEDTDSPSVDEGDSGD